MKGRFAGWVIAEDETGLSKECNFVLRFARASGVINRRAARRVASRRAASQCDASIIATV
jgi:hypothetical protein